MRGRNAVARTRRPGAWRFARFGLLAGRGAEGQILHLDADGLHLDGRDQGQTLPHAESHRDGDHEEVHREGHGHGEQDAAHSRKA